uniref:Putative secreted protein n=1 Tax=Anopheles darlingi TaxID=43151 RepID=A0A2M4DQC2_ANODA
MIGKRLDVFLLLLTIIAACLIVIVADASPVPDNNDVATWEQEGSPTVATPAAAEAAAAGSPDHDRCCLGVIKPIVLTAKPRYKYVVVPPLSIT